MARSVYRKTIPAAGGGVIDFVVVEARKDDEQKSLIGYGIVRRRTVKGQEEYVTLLRAAITSREPQQSVLTFMCRRVDTVAARAAETAKACEAAAKACEDRRKKREADRHDSVAPTVAAIPI